MSLRLNLSPFIQFLLFFLCPLAAYPQSPGVWDRPAFSASAEELRQAAALIKADKDADATMFLHEEHYSFDRDGKETQIFHSVYRVETDEGVSGWDEISADWEPWHQAKPEIRARVITADGVVHNLDLKTLNDVPVHENSPDTFTDARALGGPLPAVAIGAIVEEEMVIRDTAPFFAAGTVERMILNRTVPLTRTRVVIDHTESLPLHYFLAAMPNAKINKVSHDGIETIQIEDGPYEARSEKLTSLPADVPRGPQVEFSTGTSWQKIAAEYARLSNDKVRAADVQSLIAKINTRSGSRQEVLRRLVAALHKNVRYTGVEFGESSLVPQFPAETLKRKYGDCKDKATLLVTMLRALNIPASLALLSTGPGQDINVNLPGMGMFDHAIVFVPAAGSEPEMWIDATAQYSRVGDLPEMDYGRWALIVDEHTTELKRIPELTAAQNLHRELREFTLAEFGPAKIRETDEQIGPREADFRAFYNGDAKEVREASEKYVRQAYLAESLTALEHGDLSDLDKPFAVTFVAKGKRGNTYFDNAVMAIRVEDLMDDFPGYFTTDPKAEKQEDSEEGANPEKLKPRTVDWQISPFINEWDYKIIAPAGFKVRALPPPKEEQLQSARFTQKYSSNADGTIVEAVLRFESPKSRFTVKEAEALRDAVVKARQSDPIFITFDHAGHSLIAAGKIREGLAVYQQLAQQRPKEALPRIQLARALLDTGLAEKARVVAREAIVLEPNSAQAYSTLAWILEHDLLGRHRRKGWDYQGAVAAYRKAKELDPKDKDVRANLAMLLEYDADCRRYTANASLKEAVAEFKELKKMDAETAARYDDFVIYDLWYARDFKALEEELKSLPATDTRRGFVVALAAVNQGSEAALKKSLEITTAEDDRRKALTSAAWLVVHLHRYQEAADLLAAGSRGESTETQTAAFAATLRKARPKEGTRIDDANPRAPMQHLFASMFSARASYNQVRGLMSQDALRTESKSDEREFTQLMFRLRKQLEKEGVPIETVGDIVLGNARYTVEGNDDEGYRLTIETPGASAQEAFIVREGGSYKILDYVVNSKPPEEVGWRALDLLNKNDLPGARKWLDWAREEIHMSGSDDPLSAQPFPYFWTKGQEGDADAIRTAALVLIPSKGLKGDELKMLLKARDSAKTEQDKSRLDLVLAWAYSRQQQWTELAPVAARLLQAFPDSITAFHFMTSVYANTARLDEWDKLVQERMAKHSDELDYTRSAAELATYHGDFVRSRVLIKSLMDRSKATASDLNLYAWDALFIPGEVGQDSIEASEQANQKSQNSNFSIMHTLACIYAHAGKAAQARELLLKAMEEHLEEPDSSVWLAYGQIAEDYGEPDAARTMYARVEKAESESPTSNYALAQRRLLALKNSAVTAASNGSK